MRQGEILFLTLILILILIYVPKLPYPILPCSYPTLSLTRPNPTTILTLCLTNQLILPYPNPTPLPHRPPLLSTLGFGGDCYSQKTHRVPRGKFETGKRRVDNHD